MTDPETPHGAGGAALDEALLAEQVMPLLVANCPGIQCKMVGVCCYTRCHAVAAIEERLRARAGAARALVAAAADLAWWLTGVIAEYHAACADYPDDPIPVELEDLIHAIYHRAGPLQRALDKAGIAWRQDAGRAGDAGALAGVHLRGAVLPDQI